MERKIPIYQASIRRADNTGIFAISFVDLPANEKHFVALKRATRVKLNLNRQKQILTGVVLVPDQLIYRNDENLGEYYIKFTADDIEKISHKMMKSGLALSTTTHQHEAPLKGNYLTELWIVTDPKNDKAAALGLGELPKGTLVASYKIEDAKYWAEEVVTGKVRGFSLEGIFNFNNISKMSKPKTTAKTALGKTKPTALGTFFKSMAAFLEGETAAATDDLADVADADEVDAGEPFLIFELADGSEIYVDSEGYATLDDEQAPAGEHALTDGNFIVIDDSGYLVVTTEEAAATDPATAPAALAAKKRAKAFLAALPKDEKTAKIAKLEAQLAELKKQPSTGKAKPATATTKKDPSEMSYTEKMAAVIKSRQKAK